MKDQNLTIGQKSNSHETSKSHYLVKGTVRLHEGAGMFLKTFEYVLPNLIYSRKL